MKNKCNKDNYKITNRNKLQEIKKNVKEQISTDILCENLGVFLCLRLKFCIQEIRNFSPWKSQFSLQEKIFSVLLVVHSVLKAVRQEVEKGRKIKLKGLEM